MAEQVHPDSGAPLSVSPLTWSHATFISTARAYLTKRQVLERREGVSSA
jgi:GH15 family glucan-1,4-alpha-glucosidase